jgi:type 1 glutamine amidotransferase
MKILVLCDDIWHPGEVVSRGFSLLKDSGHTFDVVMDAKDIVSKEMLAEYPLVICCKANQLVAANHDAPWFEENITAVPPEGYREYIENGGGFIALHAGLTLSKIDEFAKLYQSKFLRHPPQCDVRVKFTGKHEILDGVSEFTVRDEHYQLEMLGDVTPLFDTESDTSGRCMGGFVREIGKGRLCAISPGHNLWVWQNKDFRRLLLNAIDWCVQK